MRAYKWGHALGAVAAWAFVVLCMILASSAIGLLLWYLLFVFSRAIS